MKTEVDFDADSLTARVAKASVDILKRMGAYVRRVAQSKVRTSPKASTPGTPPHSKCAEEPIAVFRDRFEGKLRPQGEPRSEMRRRKLRQQLSKGRSAVGRSRSDAPAPARRGAQAAARGLLFHMQLSGHHCDSNSSLTEINLMNNAVFEMIYGKPETYRAKTDVKAGELVQLGTRAAVACCDIAKGETGPVYVRGDFFFDCDPDYECDDTATIAYDFKHRRFVPVGTNGSLVIGAALFSSPKGCKFIGIGLNR